MDSGTSLNKHIKEHPGEHLAHCRGNYVFQIPIDRKQNIIDPGILFVIFTPWLVDSLRCSSSLIKNLVGAFQHIFLHHIWKDDPQ